jgi:hypothetical protein
MPWPYERIRAFLISCLMGAYFGATVATVPVTLNYRAVMSDCERLHTAADCSAARPCAWYTPPHDAVWPARCTYRDLLDKTAEGTCANMSTTSAGCVAPCAWDAEGKKCAHEPGWSPAQVGLFAGAAVGGGTVSSMGGSFIIATIFKGNLRMVYITSVVVGVIGTVLTIIGWCTNNEPHDAGVYGLIIAGRVIVGVSVGIGAIVGPMLGSLLAAPCDRTLVPLLFGPAMAFGNMLTAVLGLIADPSRLPVARVQSAYAATHAVQLLFPAIAAGVALAAPDVMAPLRNPKDSGGDTAALVNATEGGVAATSADKLPEKAPATMFGRLLTAAALSTALQYSGITAVMAFAPRLAKSGGLDPLLGNCLFMLWNWLTTFATIPISRRSTCRTMFLRSGIGSAVACLATGVLTLISAHTADGSATSKAMEGLIIVGVLAIIASYQFGLGSSFYVLAQSVFPSNERRVGATWTIAWQFIWVLTINVAYAPLQSALSGDGAHGSAGTERQGQGCLFIIFGGVGGIMIAILFRYLHPLELRGAVGHGAPNE